MPRAQMTYQLYYYPGNANLAPHILLEETGCDFELVLVDRTRQAQKSAEYLRVNPSGRIPALVRGELVLFETAAICLHIADHHPAARLAPALGSDERSHCYKWLAFLSNTVQPAYMTFRYPEQHATSPEPGAPPPSPRAVDDVRAAAAERAARAFEVIEQSFGEGIYLLGAEYSLCDAYLYMLAWWARTLPRPPIHLPRLRACIDAVAQRPATQRACATEGIEVRFESSQR
jgi:glutathione S-transferase